MKKLNHTQAMLQLIEVIGVCMSHATNRRALLDGKWSDVDLSGYSNDDLIEIGFDTGRTKLAREILEILNTKYEVDK